MGLYLLSHCRGHTLGGQQPRGREEAIQQSKEPQNVGQKCEGKHAWRRGKGKKDSYVFLSNSGKHADLKLYVPVGPELLHPGWG